MDNPDITETEKKHYDLQEQIIEFVRDYKQDPENDGNSPTYQEIAQALGKKWRANIYRYVQSLERKGLINVNKRGKLRLIGGKYIPPE